MKHYYVTGAAGWLGKAAIDRLVNGFPEHPLLATELSPESITALVLPGTGSELAEWRDKINIVEGDLQSPESCRTFFDQGSDGTLLHLAGIIHPKLFTREFQQVNVNGTENILNAAIEGGVSRAVVMSSNSPIGCNPNRDEVFDEQSPYNPYMGYGKSKMQMEGIVNALGNQGKIETVLIRGPWFYGPFQPPRQTRFFEMIRDGKAPIVGDGENRRSMVYVDNLVQGILLAAHTPEAAGQTYWIADSKPYTMNEIINTVEFLLADEFGIDCKYSRMKLPSIASEVALLCDRIIQSLGLYQQEIHVLSEMNKTIACSIDKARRELNYDPLVALELGMRTSIQQLVDDGLLAT